MYQRLSFRPRGGTCFPLSEVQVFWFVILNTITPPLRPPRSERSAGTLPAYPGEFPLLCHATVFIVTASGVLELRHDLEYRPGNRTSVSAPVDRRPVQISPAT